MTNLTAREKEQAKQCQLLTGSYEGRDPCCPCFHRGDCRFSESERDELIKTAFIRMEQSRQLGIHYETQPSQETDPV